MANTADDEGIGADTWRVVVKSGDGDGRSWLIDVQNLSSVTAATGTSSAAAQQNRCPTPTQSTCRPGCCYEHA